MKIHIFAVRSRYKILLHLNAKMMLREVQITVRDTLIFLYRVKKYKIKKEIAKMLEDMKEVPC